MTRVLGTSAFHTGNNVLSHHDLAGSCTSKVFSVARNSDSEILTALQKRNCTSYPKASA